MNAKDQAALDRRALVQARAWGYRETDPETLETAIELLQRSMEPDPNARYRDRPDPCEWQARQDKQRLFEWLEDLRQRRGEAAA